MLTLCGLELDLLADLDLGSNDEFFLFVGVEFPETLLCFFMSVMFDH